MTYTTKQGDMWDGIAYTQMGSCACTGALLDANREQRGVYIFPAGVVLSVPETDTETSADLPPWRR